ncbi:MAG: glycosyltransferase family 2 protein [Chloroflexi bacterium]|nr:glycosyltransferase family 2 protein [Chloroflexota bacterium]MCL5273799.1 glycosyltransferase family 2 protein [Chloroflexota bacterium]
MLVSLIIPALNEADCLPPLLAELPLGLVQELIVVDNGSTDGTADVARRLGAQVVVEPRRGYGYACAAGAAAAHGDVLVFMDGDGSFVPLEIPALLLPIRKEVADLVLGARTRYRIAEGSMPFHQALGNRLMAALFRILYGARITDISPFRAIRRDLLLALNMQERTYGWPMEMLVKAACRKAPIREAPVSYRRRFAENSRARGGARAALLSASRSLYLAFRHAR